MVNESRQKRSPLLDYEHDHPPIININQILDKQQTPGQKVADRVATVVGSWPFIIVQSNLLVIWIGVNIYYAINPGALKAFDPYPFILLNLALSFQAAYTGPIVMMSQNRQSAKDRMMAQQDFECNIKAENEIRIIMEHLKFQDTMTQDINQKLLEIDAKLKS